MPRQHLPYPAHPGAVLAPPQIGLPEADEQTGEREEKNNPNPRMDGARPLSAGEQFGEEEQARVEQGKAREGEQHQAGGCNPVVDARTNRVAVDRYGLAGMHAVARLDVIGGAVGIGGHGRPPSVSFSAFSSSSG